MTDALTGKKKKTFTMALSLFIIQEPDYQKIHLEIPHDFREEYH